MRHGSKVEGFSKGALFVGRVVAAEGAAQYRAYTGKQSSLVLKEVGEKKELR